VPAYSWALPAARCFKPSKHATSATRQADLGTLAATALASFPCWVAWVLGRLGAVFLGEDVRWGITTFFERRAGGVPTLEAVLHPGVERWGR